MSWILSKDFRFEASHQLPHHDGKCKRLHGHSWKGTVFVQGDVLHSAGPQQGMLVDYGVIGAAVKEMVESHLDHYHLNDVLANPTSEEVARWVYGYLQHAIPGLYAVEIEETCTARCRYTLDNRV